MIWQFTGVGPHNKGAELMFLAMQERVLSMDPNARIAMTPGGSVPYDWRASHGLWQIYDAARSGWLAPLRSVLFHQGYRERFGIIRQEEIEVVLDASGFAYGDQWKSKWIEGSATYYERLKASGTKIILLPQALGPFENERVRNASQRIFDCADHIFARDTDSLAFARTTMVNPEKISLAPDFTNLLQGRLPENWSPDPDHVAIIPNRQMLVHGNEESRRNYVPMMTKTVKQLKDAGLKPFILLHETNDMELAQNIAKQAGIPDDVIKYADPIELKGILGNCKFSIGSRFHGLISCLSQGIPAVGTSWSHKYTHLFADYDASELLVSGLSSEAPKSVSDLLQASFRYEISERIAAKSLEIKSQASAMWEMVNKIVKP